MQDPENRSIKTILKAGDLRGKEILAIGCGRGRITRNLAGYACRPVAVDPDTESSLTPADA
jgi:predicted RNA methylase